MGRLQKRVDRVAGTDSQVRMWRRRFERWSRGGYVIQATPAAVLLQVLDSDTFTLGDYVAIRRCDITRCRRQLAWIEQRVRDAGPEPLAPEGIDVRYLQNLLVAVNERYPLFTIACEETNKGAIYIGRIARLTNKHLWLHWVDTKGRWRKPRKYRLDDITLVEFGDGYATNLAAVAGPEPPLTGRFARKETEGA